MFLIEVNLFVVVSIFNCDFVGISYILFVYSIGIGILFERRYFVCFWGVLILDGVNCLS